MSILVWTVTVAATLGQFPTTGCRNCGPAGGGGGAVYSEPIGGVPVGGEFSGEPGFVGDGARAHGSSYGHEQLYPYDAYDNWVHGHWQDIPAYGGYHSFRPYNYKHLLSQSQVAGGWGMSPQYPYSHEYFRRGREHVSAGRATNSYYAQQNQRDVLENSLTRLQQQRRAEGSFYELPQAPPSGYAPDDQAYRVQQATNVARYDSYPAPSHPGEIQQSYNPRLQGPGPTLAEREQPAHLEALHEQVRQQNLQLQALQQALDQQQQQQQYRAAPRRYTP